MSNQKQKSVDQQEQPQDSLNGSETSGSKYNSQKDYQQQEITSFQVQQQKKKKNDKNNQKFSQQIDQSQRLSKINIIAPLKKSLVKSQSKIPQKQVPLSSNNNKKEEKLESKYSKKHHQQINQNYKTSPSHSHLSPKVNKPFYEETFYITGMKQNFLLLLSDSNQVLEFPIGMFAHQKSQLLQQQSQNDQIISQSSQNKKFVQNDIKIGQPIKIKLEFDFLRQQKDKFLFNSLQKSLHAQFSESQ